MFAIVDIETTGGSAGRNKITEICILIHDGLTVVDKFTTLIHPECRIPSSISRLTGITDEMVATAPKFYEVARKIVEMTEGMIFVAHNVGFDYGFIQEEFKSLGYNFKREKLCTVRLSRKLLPGKPSYSLGVLCESIGIEIEARHRAEGDAVATAKLFDLLLQLKSQHPVYRRQDITEISTTRIDKIKLYILKKLPEECGVYYFYDKDGNIIYIGKSNNMRSRAIAHFNNKDGRARKMLFELTDVDWVKTGSELIALLHESDEIKKHKPKYNRARKKDVFTHSIDWFENDTGVINFKIVPYEESERSVRGFTNYMSARDLLDMWVDDHTLCQSHCGLNESGGECFHHHIKKCNGICIGEEEAEEYNKRARKVLEEYLFAEKSFLLLDRGRHDDEQSIVLMEDGHYAGYGYFDVSDPVTSPEELKGYVKRATYFPDADMLVRAFVKKDDGKAKVVPLS